MEPVNSRSLFHHLCKQMDKLEKKEINVQEANAQANLVEKARNLLQYELNRSKLTGKELREIESKGFDNYQV